MDVFHSCAWCLPSWQAAELFGFDPASAVYCRIPGGTVVEGEAVSHLQHEGLCFRGCPSRPRILSVRHLTLYRCFDPSWFIWTGLGGVGDAPSESASQTEVNRIDAGFRARDGGRAIDLAEVSERTCHFRIALVRGDLLDSRGMTTWAAGWERSIILSALTPAEVLE